MDDELQQQRTTLLELRVDAAERLATTSRMLQSLLADRAGANDDDEHDPDGATLSSEWSRLTGLEEAAAAKLAQVDDALARLDAGTYGICVSCGQPIPAARLEARPFAERCVRCAEKFVG
ncbi:TraR/DksA family transcriptional regulator [Cumulibacter manganitolerans]|uniref:TraR/DksA family transcriptional regulator n=1 Tax=Cumulibacter manganitolerans TaxID=1884992 RepID=UPI001295C17F|nr:TraR/DksA family transcriptional regulator [Cumulibacter manganitolerans]